MGWLERHWMWVAAGGVAAALMLTAKDANAIAVTLAPSLTAPQAVNVPRGGTLTIALPAGATWVNVSAASISTGTNTVALSGSAPFTVTKAQASAVLVFQWKDASGTAQMSTLSVAVV